MIVDLLAADDVHRRKTARDRLTNGDAIFAPADIDIEVVAALCGLARRSDVLADDAPLLIRQYLRMPIGASRSHMPWRTGSGSCERT